MSEVGNLPGTSFDGKFKIGKLVPWQQFLAVVEESFAMTFYESFCKNVSE